MLKKIYVLLMTTGTPQESRSGFSELPSYILHQLSSLLLMVLLGLPGPTTVQFPLKRTETNDLITQGCIVWKIHQGRA